MTAASDASFLWQAEEIQPFQIVFTSTSRLRVLRRLAAFYAAINDVGGSAEGCCDIDLIVLVVWLKKARHHVVHGRFWILRRHVKPYSCSHGQEPILMNQVRVLEQEKLAVVGARRGKYV